MQRKIDSEPKVISKTDEITSDQVLMWAKQEEALRTQILEVEQTKKEMRKESTCRYCGYIHQPSRCPVYGKMYGGCGRENHFSAVCRAPGWAVNRLEEQENRQINGVNTDHFILNYSHIRSSIETKLNTSSFYNSTSVKYKLDTGRNNNSILFHIFKTLFPKAANKGIRQPKSCKLKIIHNEKGKKCVSFL